MTNKSVHVTRERTCPVCQKRLGDKYFVRFPNGQVVHFKCAGPEPPFTVCPVTKEGMKLFLIDIGKSDHSTDFKQTQKLY